MNEILISALIARIKACQMTIQQVPFPYQPIIEMRLKVLRDVLAQLKDQGEGDV